MLAQQDFPNYYNILSFNNFVVLWVSLTVVLSGYLIIFIVTFSLLLVTDSEFVLSAFFQSFSITFIILHAH